MVTVSKVIRHVPPPASSAESTSHVISETTFCSVLRCVERLGTRTVRTRVWVTL